MVQTMVFKKIYTYNMSRDLFRVHSENTSPAGIKKNIPVRWYQTSKYCVSAFCSYSFHLGTIGIPLQLGFAIFLYQLGLKGFFLLMGMFGAGRALIYSLLFSLRLHDVKKKYKPSYMMLTRCRQYPTRAVRALQGGGGGLWLVKWLIIRFRHIVLVKNNYNIGISKL